MKRIITTMLMIVLILSMFSTVYAATGSINVGASADKVEKGKSFTVTVTATADTPIDAMYTKINYDTKVIKLESIEVAKDYSDGNSGEGEIFLINKASTTAPKSVTLCTIKFTVLKNATQTSTKISFEESELHLNNKAVEAKVEDVEVEIKAKEETNTNTNTNTDKNNGTTNTNKNNASTNNKLPQTGLEEVSVVLVVALGILLIVTYISCRKYKDI